VVNLNTVFTQEIYIDTMEKLKTYRLKHLGREWKEEATLDEVQFALLLSTGGGR
jgi:hypothetical protein